MKHFFQRIIKICSLILKGIFILPIFLYQKLISPLLPVSCIYSPTCSHYSKEAIMKHGVLKGSALAITRIFRCTGGLYTGGNDPVPEVFSFKIIADGYRKHWRKSPR
ncbi:MAG: membrane protein insertion efficiency factor YidD [Spirochaetales bacterium]|nr:membrane protein insertion efficiency factor YidD [Spirochaetales bacterium]